jgi:hypothetical protein
MLENIELDLAGAPHQNCLIGKPIGNVGKHIVVTYSELWVNLIVQGGPTLGSQLTFVIQALFWRRGQGVDEWSP